MLTFTKKVLLAVRPVLVASVALGGISAITPMRSGLAQNLDDAVDRQLASDGATNCVVLLGGQSPLTELTGTLQQICSILPGLGQPPPSSATGGGAATPATLPGIVQRRLREARGEETKEAQVSAASADAALERRSGRGFFISAEGGTSDLSVTPFEAAYNSDIQGLTVGVDFEITARSIAGLVFDYTRQDGDFEGGGDFDNRSFGLVGFGSFLPTDKTFVQFYAGYAWKDNERTRFASWEEDNQLVTGGFVDADSKGDEYQVGALAGYDFPIKNITISPRAGFDWRRTEFDSYSETGVQTAGDLAAVPVRGSTGLELRFDEDRVTSLQSRVGVQAQVTISAGSVVIVPQASIDLRHESENKRRDVTVSFVEDLRQKRFTYEIEDPNRLDRNWAEWNIGVVAVFRNGLQLFGNYRTLTEHEFFDSDVVTIGLRAAF